MSKPITYIIYCTCKAPKGTPIFSRERVLRCGCDDLRRKPCDDKCKSSIGKASKCVCECYGANHGINVSDAARFAYAGSR